jgi:Bacterial Ig domain
MNTKPTAICLTHGMASLVAVAAMMTARPSAAQTSPDRPSIRPQAIFLQAPWEHLKGSGEVDRWRGSAVPQVLAGPGQAPFRVYLNRFGGTYCSGPDDATQNTSIVPNGCGTIAPYPYGDASWTQLRNCVADQFAPFNIAIVEQEPAGNVEYAEHVVGGRPQDVGLPNGVGGVAPIDNFQCGVLTHAINYTFAAVYGNDPQSICETAAQEIAHSFSLDHAYLCTDPMTYLSGCGDKSFQDEDAQCGEYQPRQCNCGRNRQNSVQLMYELLGPAEGEIEPPVDDPVFPTVNISQPNNGAVLPLTDPIVVIATAADNLAVAALELNWNISELSFGCPTNSAGGAVVCSRSGNTATWTIIPSQGGARTFSVSAIDSAGNVTTTAERTINLDVDAPPPVSDGVNPVVAVSSPANGATLLGNNTIQVVATATDNSALSAVELVWTYTGDVFPCPFEGNSVACEQSGDTFTWSLNVGLGQRGFLVRAVDAGGNQASTAERIITLSTEGPGDEPTPPPDNGGADLAGEPNNSPAEAFPLRCGSAIDLISVGGDDDYFAIGTATGIPVDVSIASSTGDVRLQLMTSDGLTELASSANIVADGGTLRAISPDDVGVLARVTTLSGRTPYRMTVVCGGGGDLVEPGEDDDLEDNDDAASATIERCPGSREGLVASDPDYYRLQVRAGDRLTVTLTAAGTQATILSEAGDVLAGPSGTASAANLPAGDVLVRVTPAAGAVPYGYRFDCAGGTGELNNGVAVSSCGGCSGGLGGAWMGVLVVVLRRRKQRQSAQTALPSAPVLQC